MSRSFKKLTVEVWSPNVGWTVTFNPHLIAEAIGESKGVVPFTNDKFRITPEQ